MLGVGGQLYRWEEVQVCSVGDVAASGMCQVEEGQLYWGEGQLYWGEGQG